jgi:endonuclease/exonuclease/phosphatase family metal-dependent hydrolase
MAAGLLAGCTSLPATRVAGCAASAPPALVSDGQTAHAQLDVLTYNIEGLGWPARRGRGAQLAEIGRRLAALRAAGQAPDVIVFQEVFSGDARRAVESAGYPALVAGPSVWKRRDLPSSGRVPKRHWKQGELGLKLLSGGLVIVSRYPIVAYRAEPFSHRSCAGSDCLSNKGALLARVAVPGVPDPVDIFDAHMNSRRVSGASRTRTLAAHLLETRELNAFIQQASPGPAPLLLAGDFNMRHSQARFDAFELAEPLTMVHQYCLKDSASCQSKIAWKSPTPWLDTEDLQFFKAGQRVDVRPVRVDSLFDGRPDSPVLSDHTALRVVYDLSWKVGAAPTRLACPVGPRPTVIAARGT